MLGWKGKGAASLSHFLLGRTSRCQGAGRQVAQDSFTHTEKRLQIQLDMCAKCKKEKLEIHECDVRVMMSIIFPNQVLIFYKMKETH